MVADVSQSNGFEIDNDAGGQQLIAFKPALYSAT
jgi:hypothetical protein